MTTWGLSHLGLRRRDQVAALAAGVHGDGLATNGYAVALTRAEPWPAGPPLSLAPWRR